jgi:hypothetical protein
MGGKGKQIFVRRILLELWAMLVIASIVGFMGPFGTYAGHGLVDRVVHWWQLLMGAYLLVRPTIFGLHLLAKATELPLSVATIWGVVVVSVPLGVLWRHIGEDTFRALDDYTDLLPFSLLCAVAVLGVTHWSVRADRRLSKRSMRSVNPPELMQAPITGASNLEQQAIPVLRARLPQSFRGPILALQSEDHYVRVHGEQDSELVLIRLRDAIAEMDGVSGVQVHRSWWVACDAISKAEPTGRSWNIVLINGTIAPVARDSVTRLQSVGILREPLTTG